MSVASGLVVFRSRGLHVQYVSRPCSRKQEAIGAQSCLSYPSTTTSIPEPSQGIEFAAEGSTADPFLLLRVGKKEAKTSPLADVPGGTGGRCSWPASGALTMKGVTLADLRQSGFEVWCGYI